MIWRDPLTWGKFPRHDNPSKGRITPPKGGYKSRMRVGMAVENFWEVRHESNEEKYIPGRRKSYLDLWVEARLPSSHHGWAKNQRVGYESSVKSSPVTWRNTSWTSHRGISPTQSTSKLGIQAQKLKAIGNGPPQVPLVAIVKSDFDE